MKVGHLLHDSKLKHIFKRGWKSCIVGNVLAAKIKVKKRATG